MASRNFKRTQSLNNEVKLICGRFDDADTSIKGLGWSAANTGTGTYTITLEDKYPHLLSFTATVQCTSGTDDYSLCVVSSDVSSAKTIDIEVAVAGTLTDLGSGDQIHFMAALQNSSLPAV